MRKLTGPATLLTATALAGAALAVTPAAQAGTLTLTFTQKPAAVTESTTATFAWTAADASNASATFSYQCSQTPPGGTASTPVGCTSPVTLSNLQRGTWSFFVNATETSPPGGTVYATYTWNIVAPPAPKPGVGLGAAAPNGSTLDVYDLNTSNKMEWSQHTSSGWAPPGQMYSGSPVSGPAGTTLSGVSWVYATTSAHTLVSWESGSGYRSYTSYLGATVTGRPGVAVATSGRIDVFARGGNGHLLHNYYLPATHHLGAWQDLGFTLPAGAGAAAVSNGLDKIVVAVRGTDNAVWLFGTTNLGSSWSHVRLGGTTYSDPAVTSPVAGVVDVFLRSTTRNNLYQDHYASGHWSGWVNRGGTLTNAPTATSNAQGIPTTVFVLGPDNKIWVWTASLGWFRGP